MYWNYPIKTHSVQEVQQGPQTLNVVVKFHFSIMYWKNVIKIILENKLYWNYPIETHSVQEVQQGPQTLNVVVKFHFSIMYWKNVLKIILENKLYWNYPIETHSVQEVQQGPQTLNVVVRHLPLEALIVPLHPAPHILQAVAACQHQQGGEAAVLAQQDVGVAPKHQPNTNILLKKKYYKNIYFMKKIYIYFMKKKKIKKIKHQQGGKAAVLAQQDVGVAPAHQPKKNILWKNKIYIY